MPERVKIGEVLRAGLSLGAECWPTAAGALAFITCSGALVDVAVRADLVRGANGLLGLLNLYIQLLVTSRALLAMGLLPETYDPRRPTLGRYPAAFVQSLLYWIGVLAGLVLLILPGLFLAIRWAVALPALLGEELPAATSLARSWRLTASLWPTALIVQLLSLPLLAAAVFLTATVYPGYGPVPLPAALGANLFLGLWLVTNSLMMAALYGCARRREALADPA